MISRKPWSVLRLWWELTKLIAIGGARWEIGAYLTNPHVDYDPHIDAVVNAANWHIRDLNWVGGEDRFVVLDAYPDKLPTYRQGASR